MVPAKLFGRRALAFCALFLLGSVGTGQSSVDQLFNASDAGQRTFDQSQQAGSPGASAIVYDASTVDTLPTYLGGDTALFKRLTHNDACAQANGLDGCVSTKVVVGFIVEKDGTVTSPKVLQEACPALRTAALCAIKNVGTWSPGWLHGEAVRVRMSVPIIYDLR